MSAMRRCIQGCVSVLAGLMFCLCAVAQHAGAGSSARVASGEELLLQAAAQGDAVSARRLLAEGVAASTQDAQRGFSALHNAAAMGHVAIVELLMAAGAPVDAQDRNGVTALISAAYHGHASVLTQLLAHGADVHHRPQAGPMALAAALYAGSVPALQVLLAAGADPALPDAFGVNAYEVAERMGRPELSAALPARSVLAGGDDD